MEIVRINDFVFDKFLCFFEKNSGYIFWSFFLFLVKIRQILLMFWNFLPKFQYHIMEEGKEKKP